MTSARPKTRYTVKLVNRFGCHYYQISQGKRSVIIDDEGDMEEIRSEIAAARRDQDPEYLQEYLSSYSDHMSVQD
jgi:hypothetical protein